MTRMRLTGLLRLVSLLIALIGVTLTISAPAAAAARTDLSSSDALYPRLVRLSHNADTAKNQKYKCLMRLKKLFFAQYKKED